VLVQEHQILLQLIDDGYGFDVNEMMHKGVGIINMKHRIHLLGGTVEWHSAINSGTKVDIILPIQKQNL
jgi:NarL family two-component system sensor histidine kinase LiaS